MSQNTKKPYDLPDWPAEAEQTQEAPRPRRKRRAPAEPEDLWGKLRFRAGKKVRWFGRRCRRVVRGRSDPVDAAGSEHQRDEADFDGLTRSGRRNESAHTSIRKRPIRNVR